MTPTDYIINLTGLGFDMLFDPKTGLVKLSSDVHHNITIDQWNVPGIPQPTSAQIMAAILPPTANIQAGLKAYAEQARATCAAKGITVNVDTGSAPKMVFASTDAASLTILTGSLQYLQINPTATIHWVCQTGTFELTQAEVQALAVAAFAYIQTTFTLQAGILAAITSGSIVSNAQIDAAYAAGLLS